MHRPAALLATLLVVSLGLAAPVDSRADDDLSRQVRPILARCVKCHSGEEPAAELDLTTRASALRGGESGDPALVPNDPSASPLYRLVAGRKMPPKRPLPQEDADLLRRWIEGGASWGEPIRKDEAPHEAAADESGRWAFRPVVRPTQPPVKDSSWPSQPIDTFVLARLEKEGMKPSPPAERRALIRRLSFDLRGLPPTPEEIDHFVDDPRPDAYEALVDRFLASPAYGERWGRHWLDLARFAESHGFEYDRLRDNAWPYRDYVIASLNADTPYDRFVREQIAGDVLEPTTADRIAATGLLVAGPWDEAGAGQVSEVMRARIREEELEDMVAVVGQTFLGLTVNCARCHDHKFDPITQVDYYRFKAALEYVRHGNRPSLPPHELAAREARKAELAAAIDRLERELEEVERPALADVAEDRLPGPAPVARRTFERDARDVAGSLPGTLVGGAVVLDGRLRLDGRGACLKTAPLRSGLRAKTLEAWVRLARLDQRGGAVVSVEQASGLTFDAIVFGENEPRSWSSGSEFFRRTRHFGGPTETSPPDRTIHIAIVHDADGLCTAYREGRPYGSPYTIASAGSALPTYSGGEAHVLLGLRHNGAQNGFLEGEIEEARIYDRALTAEEIAASYRFGFRRIDRLAVMPAETRERSLSLRAELKRTRANLADATVEPKVYAANPVPAAPTRVLGRGDVAKPGKVVAAGGIAAVAVPSPEFGLQPESADAVRRQSLAAWIADPRNPLTARVMVNRLWHYHFGAGLVGTPNDFGMNGERPTHPELLGWLAAELVEQDWRLKPIHRQIVLSSTYRQASHHDAALAARDAESRLLWRFPPRRLEAEAVRDAMLAASGTWNTRMGGPSFRPFTVTVFNSSFYTPIDSADPELNRRSVYRMNVNSGKDPVLDVLDCPDPSVKTPRRAVTTTPLQALGMMNDPFVTRISQALADRLVREEPDRPEARIDRAYRLVLGRPPTDAERPKALQLDRDHGLPAVAWVLFNTTEFVYVR